MKNWKYAERAYAAYAKATCTDDVDITDFWGLEPDERDGWYAAAQAVIESVCRGD